MDLSKLAPKKKQPPMERLALRKIRQEAKLLGSTLQSNGEGGLPSSLCLHVMRRDNYRCTVCGGRENITLHHVSHVEVPRSKWLLKHPENDRDPRNIATICQSCHDKVHGADRALSEEAEEAGAETPSEKHDYAKDHGEAV